ncbi:MAG: Mut7-C RNAse domain-containing protein [Pseudomonadota bacterium]
MANLLPRFLCDAMLARFGRYLRAAGFDTALADNHASDAEILRQAAAEDRWLLTADYRIMEHKAAAGRAVLLPFGSLDAQAQVLKSRFELDWLKHAFTRCLEDNAALVAATPEQILMIPADARRPNEPRLACPACGRVYWQGSHYKRMRSRLVSWQATGIPPPGGRTS